MEKPQIDTREYTEWVSLPPLNGELWVGMVTEVLDERSIPNIVSTDLAAGGIGVVSGTTTVGKPWRIKVPSEFLAPAMEIFESLMGDHGDASEENEPS